MMMVAIKKMDAIRYFPLLDKVLLNQAPNSMVKAETMMAAGMDNTRTA